MKIEDIVELKEQAVAEANAAEDERALEEVRIAYLSRKGKLPEIMKGLKDLDAADRPRAGQAANELKQELQAAMDRRKEALETASEDAGAESFDYTRDEWMGSSVNLLPATRASRSPSLS